MSIAKTTYSMILCSLISKRSETKGVAQKDFFHGSGVATGTWSRMTRGQAHFQIEDLRAACDLLDWTVGDLTAEADKIAKQLARKEEVKVVSKDDLKSQEPTAGGMIALAALAFLVLKLSK